MKKSEFSHSVLITGANRGIGLGLVKHYLGIGFTVLATAKNTKKSEALLELQKKYDNRLWLLELDVTSEISISNFTKQIKGLGTMISVVINNAGISVEEEFGHWTMATFETHFRVNSIGPALVSQAVLPYMVVGAKLIQISSGMGSIQWNINPINGFDAYAASKCALHSITVRLAEKLKDRQITVVAINPGWVKTDMGGQEAPTMITEAVNNISGTIDKLSYKFTGHFLSDVGEQIPW